MIPSILERAVLTHGDEPAVRHGDHTLDYRTMAGRISRRATQLCQAATDVGDRVAVLAGNGPIFYELSFAAAHAGLVLVPLNTRLPPATLARLLHHSGAASLWSEQNFAELGAAAVAAADAGIVHEVFIEDEWTEPLTSWAPMEPRPRGPDDPAHIYYTSGTTGEPKGVVLTHRNVCSHALMAIAALGIDDRDVFAHLAPMFHLADAWATYAVTWVGGQHRFAPRFAPEEVLALLRADTTLTNLVPTMLSDLVHHPQARADYPSLRRLLSGGAPISPRLVRDLVETFGCPYVQTYGLTETSPFLTMSLLPARFDRRSPEEQLAHRGKTGRPLVGVDVRVVRETGEEVTRDGREVGEIVARGDSVTPGYWRNPEATAAAFRDGWFLTGDLATIDADGFLDIVDRKKDVVLSGGETVYSTEVEHTLAEHPAVKEVAVVGLPHPRWGEVVSAFVVRKEGAPLDEAGLIEFASQRLAGFQRPRTVVFLDALPRTGTGKLAKRLLREEFREPS